MRPKADCYECLAAIMNDLFGVVVMPLLRQPDYFFQTLASLFVLESNVGKVTPVHLIAGSTDLARTWTALAQHDDAEPMHPIGKEERHEIADRSAHRRFPRNLCGAGRFSRISKYGKCVCEDNILFMDGLVDKPLVGVEEMRQAECGYVYLPFDSALDPDKEAAIAAATRPRLPSPSAIAAYLLLSLFSERRPSSVAAGVQVPNAPAVLAWIRALWPRPVRGARTFEFRNCLVSHTLYALWRGRPCCSASHTHRVSDARALAHDPKVTAGRTISSGPCYLPGLDWNSKSE
jgi:hypothetical protein